MVMITEHDPCLKSPVILLRDGKETIVEEGQTLRFLEEMLLLVGPRCNNVCSRFFQPMNRCVRPVYQLATDPFTREHVLIVHSEAMPFLLPWQSGVKPLALHIGLY